jgi:PAS domain S-box-containing protein
VILSGKKKLKLMYDAVASSINAIGITDLQGKLIYVNDACVKTWGYDSEDEILGRSLPEFWEGDGIFNTIKELQEKGVASGEDIGKKKDGTVFIVQFAANLFTDEAGNPAYMFVSFLDITERKKAEGNLQKIRDELELMVGKRTAELNKANTRLETLLRSIPDLVSFKDASGRYLAMNLAFEEFMGMSHDELIEKTTDDIFPPEIAAQCKQSDEIAMRNPGPTRSEEYIDKGEGGVFLDTIKASIRNDEGNIQGLVVVSRDITERKQADELLRDSKLKYQNLIESTSDLVWEVDEEGRYTYVSPRIRDLLGYEPEEVVHRTPFDLMPPKEAKRVREIFATAVAQHEPINSLENTNLHKDGHPVILETSGDPFFDAGGKFCGYRGIDRDITVRKQTENKLLEQRENLKETNIALRVILRESEITKNELEQNVLSNIKDLLLPYVTELGTRLLVEEQQFFLDIIKANINEITSSFSRKLKLEFADLTPREIQVADLIKQGRTNKEIARLLNITASGVDFHRRNLRKKLNIKGKRINLRSHLLSFVV